DPVAKSQGPISVSFLWQQHNEHRIFFPKLFYLADLYLAGGRNILLLVSIFVVQMLHLGLWGYLFRRYARLSGPAWRTALGVAAFCLFNPNQVENFVWGFEITFVISGFAATGALACLVRYSEDLRSGQGRSGSADYLLLALFAAIVSSY